MKSPTVMWDIEGISSRKHSMQTNFFLFVKNYDFPITEKYNFLTRECVITRENIDCG